MIEPHWFDIARACYSPLLNAQTRFPISRSYSITLTIRLLRTLQQQLTRLRTRIRTGFLTGITVAKFSGPLEVLMSVSISWQNRVDRGGRFGNGCRRPDTRLPSAHSFDNSDDCDGDVSGSGGAEGSGHFVGGGAGCQDVVDDQDAFAGDTSKWADSEGSVKVLQA